MGGRHVCAFWSLNPACTLQFAIYPLELVRTRLAVCPKGTYRGIWDCWGQIVRKEGWSCFYRGLTPSLVSLPAPDSPSCGLSSGPCPSQSLLEPDQAKGGLVLLLLRPHAIAGETWAPGACGRGFPA